MAEDPNLAKEIKQVHCEPLLAVEKKLIVWSLLLGVGLLLILVWVSHRFFPG